MTFDVYTLGEAMLRLSTPAGVPLETAPAFEVHIAGAETNVATTLAGLGRSVTWASVLPDSPLGRKVLSELRGAGIDCSGVHLDPDGRMGIYYVDVQTPPRPTSVVYDRTGSAVCNMKVESLDRDLISSARVVHLTGITPALSSSLADVTRVVAETAADSDAVLTFDVNYRAKLWSPAEAAAGVTPLMEMADIIICGRQDASGLFGIDEAPAGTAAALAGRFGARSVIVTDGSEGAWWVEGDREGQVGSIPVGMIDRLGAGDAFTAGIIDGVLDGDLAAGVSRGTALAAAALTTIGDQVRITRSEMMGLLEGSGRDVDR